MGQDIVEPSLRKYTQRVVGLKVNNNYSIYSRLIQTMGGARDWERWFGIMIMITEGAFSNACAKGVILGVTAISRCASAFEGW